MRIGNETKYIEWDGSNLTIKSDTLDIGGKSAATTTDVNNAKTAAENAAKEYADDIVNNTIVANRNLLRHTSDPILTQHTYRDGGGYYCWNNSTTLIIVDSDCDGFCSSAILINYLNRLFQHSA